jgi:methylmalonyl-CoA mutase cobalamin-binding subunit
MSAPATDALLPRDLPDGRALIEDGRALARGVSPGVSLLCQEHGVRSEVAYKKKMLAEDRLMTVMDIGMQTWAETAKALRLIHAETERRGFRIDRYNLILDRRMGMPRDHWERAAKETGPMLETDEDWLATTQTVPIQPHLGDYMIGSPMSVENAVRALEAGVTYIGNMSQFAWKYPGWGDDVAQMVEMTKALGVMAANADADAMVHSYLDDGYGAQFRDYSSYLGWAMFERYIIHDLVGAKLSIAYGGLTHNPAVKTAVILALEATKPPDTYTAYYHGNTTAYTADIERNYAVLATDMLYMLMAQLRTRSGSAVYPVPVMEAVRVPSWQEIVDAHSIARRVAEDAHRLIEIVDWSRIEQLRDQLVAGGEAFCRNLLSGLSDLGVDTQDPLQLLLATRRLGPVEIEDRFGTGEHAPEEPGGYRPIIPTDTLRDFLENRTKVRGRLEGRQLSADPDRLRLVVGSTDVHEYGMLLVVEALRALSVEPIVAGTSVDPDEFADLALEAGATALLVSTHNGMALTYAQQLQRELEARRLALPVLMGGTLNQDVADSDTPVDVRDDLRAIGVLVCDDVADVVDALAESA